MRELGLQCHTGDEAKFGSTVQEALGLPGSGPLEPRRRPETNVVVRR